MSNRLARREAIARGAAIALAAAASLWTGITLVRRRQLSPELQAIPAAPESTWRALVRPGHRIGPSNAAVEIAVFSDYQCAACKLLWRRVSKLLARRPDVTLRIHHLPLETHGAALSAAIAAECAANQGRFRQYHDALFGSQQVIGRTSWTQFAVRSGVADTARFNVCMSSPEPLAAVEADIRVGTQFHSGGVPVIVIGDIAIAGVPSNLTQLLDRQVRLRSRGVERRSP